MSPNSSNREPLAGRDGAGKEWYVRAEDNPNYYFTVYVKWNPFSRSMAPLISNPLYGDPSPGIPEMPAEIYKQLKSGRLKGYQ